MTVKPNIIPFPSGKGNLTRRGKNQRYVLGDGGGVQEAGGFVVAQHQVHVLDGLA